MENTNESRTGSSEDAANSCASAVDKLYKHIVEALPNAVWIVGKDARTQYANQHLATLLGTTPAQLLGRLAQEMSASVPGRTGISGALQQVCLAASDSINGIWQLQRLDGQPLRVRGNISPLWGDDQQCEGAIAILEEIAERKQPGDLHRFQTHLLDMVGNAILAIDLNGNILYRNGLTDRLYGPSGTSPDSSWQQELAIITRVSRRKNWEGELLLHCWDGSTFPALVTASPLYDDQNELMGTLVSIVDISSQKRAEKSLERYVRRLENLHQIDHAILVSQSPEKIAQTVVTYIRELVLCTRASVTVFDYTNNESVLMAVQTTSPKTQTGERTQIGINDLPAELLDGRIFITDDLEKFPGVTPHFKAIMAQGARAYVRIPLVAQGHLIGSLNMADDEIHTFTQERLEVAQEIADQLAIALHNAQLLEKVRHYATELEARVESRTAELSEANVHLHEEIRERRLAEANEREQRALAEALRDSATALNSTLNLDEVLDRILSNVVRVVDHDLGDICLTEGEMVRVVRSRGYQAIGAEGIAEIIEVAEITGNGSGVTISWPLAEMPQVVTMIETRQPAIFSAAQMDQVAALRGTISELPRLHSGVCAPIWSGGVLIGLINLGSKSEAYYDESHAERLKVFADQASVAIQNARLYERSQQVAVLEERQRLSHELHDSVSQTLWSASLIADVLPDLWEIDQAEGRHTLMRLRQLARGALAEMRTLLLELHPTALLEVNFGDLIQRLAEVTASRTGIPVSPVLEGQITLLPDVQVALYRIAQEALSNIAKHAAATAIAVHVRCEPDAIQLQIRDNGRGFFPDRSRPGHLGLGFMRQRAQAVNADLDIHSEIGEGTLITVTWRNEGSRTHD